MDFDEHIDPLDPRFVDAVLARARRRAENEDAARSPAPPSAATAAAPAVDDPVATRPVVSRPAVAAPATAPLDVAPRDVAPREVAPTSVDVAPASVFGDDTSPATTTVVAPVSDGPGDDSPDDLDLDETDAGEGRRTRNLVEWIAVAVGAVVVAFLIRAFLLQAFYIPSESMEPTLYENDRILVNKLSYKLHDVNRGDLVVFEKPANEPASGIKDLIKRTIALPNETIELQPDGRILIDGRELNEPYLADGQQPGQMTMARGNFVDGACTNPPEETTRCTIGEGFVWVMGDNRDHSHDSRAFGPINEDLIVGRAFVKVWPLSEIGFL